MYTLCCVLSLLRGVMEPPYAQAPATVVANELAEVTVTLK